MPTYIYLVYTSSVSIIFTAIYNKGNGQLWLAILLHAVFNTLNWLMLPLIPDDNTLAVTGLYVGLMVILAIITVLKYHRENLFYDQHAVVKQYRDYRT